MQLHPYIINLIAEDRIAQFHAQADAARQARAARRPKAAKRHVSRGRAVSHRAPAQASRWSSVRPVVDLPAHEERELLSVGRAGSYDCL